MKIKITSLNNIRSIRNKYESCYSIVELETSWKKETCIPVELGNFSFFPIWFEIILYINSLFMSNDRYNFSFN